ncbi:hypothetical protein [Streptomyces sp. NPDC005012]|uniref:hypothetical protein n=1 Tax=Streptomyces sp. NPDC005012 TaxID=3154558 RepID=UPI0033AC438F
MRQETQKNQGGNAMAELVEYTFHETRGAELRARAARSRLARAAVRARKESAGRRVTRWRPYRHPVQAPGHAPRPTT